MLQKSYGINAMKKSQAYEWYRRFKNGQDDTTDRPRSGWPASVTSRHILEFKELLDIDRRIIREIGRRLASAEIFTQKT